MDLALAKVVQFLSSQNSDLRELVSQFLAQHPLGPAVVDSCDWTKGWCQTAAKDLAEFLIGQGLPAQQVELQGFKGELGPDAHPDWKEFVKKPSDKQFLWHMVVKVGGQAIDLSGRQYGSAYGGVMIVPFSTLRKLWLKVKVLPTIKSF